MSEYIEHVDIVANVKTSADTTGLSKDIQKIFDKPFIVKLDSDTSGLFNDIRKDVGKIQSQLEKTLNGLDFSKVGDGLRDAFKTIDLSGLSDQIAKAIASGAQNGSKNIEEVMLDMKKQSDNLNKQLQDKRLALAQEWAKNKYESLTKKSEELKSPQAVVDKLKKLKITAKDLGSISGIEAWSEKLESQFNTSNLKDLVKDLSKSLNSAIKTDTTRLIETNLNQIKQDLTYLEGMRVQPELKVKVDGLEELQKAKTAIQDFQELMNQVIMEGSDVKFGSAIQGIYNTTGSLQKAIVTDGESASLKVNGIKTIQLYVQALLKALGAVKDEAGKYDFSNSITSQFKEISEAISQLIPKINQMADALQKISDSSILPSSAYQERINQIGEDIQKQSDIIEAENKRIKDAYAERSKIIYENAEDIRKLTDPVVVDGNDKPVKSATTKMLMNANRNYQDYANGEKLNNAQVKAITNSITLLEEYLRLGGKIEDLNVGKLTSESPIVKAAQANIAKEYGALNAALEERTRLTAELTKQQQQLNVALAKEGNITSEQKQETPEEEPKETPKPKKPPKNAISQEDFLNVRDIAEENARKIFDNKGYKYFELSASQAENGLAKVTAKVKDASDQWRSFNAVITETGDLISPKFGKKPFKNQSKIEDSYLDSETESIHLSIQEQQDAVDELRTQLGLADKEKWSISVDESGFVTIQNNLQQIGDEAYQAVQKFRSVEEAVNNFNIKAKKSLVSYSNEVDDSAEKQLKKIMDLSSSGKLSSNEKDAFSTAERYNSINKLGISNYANLKIESGKLLREINSTLNKGNLSSDDISKVISDYERFTQILQQVENAAKDAEKAFGKILDTSKLQDKSSSMLKWLQNNPIADGKFGNQVRALAEQIKSAFTQIDFENISAQFSTIVNQATAENLLGKPKKQKDTSIEEAKKKADQAKKVLENLTDHSLAADMAVMESKIKKFFEVGGSSDELTKAAEKYKKAFEELSNIQKEISSGKSFDDYIDRITSNMKDMSDAMSVAENKLKELKSVQDSLTEINKIVSNFGKLQNDVTRLENLFNPYKKGGMTDSIQNATAESMREYLKIVGNTIKSGVDNLDTKGQADLIDAYHKLTAAIKDTDVATKALKQSTKGMLTESDRTITVNKMRKWLEDNSRATKEYGEEINDLIDQMKKANTILDKQNIMEKFNKATSEAGARGLTGRDWFGSLKETFSHISQIFGSYSIVDMIQDGGRQMIQYSRDVDTAMTNLRMATGVTKDEAKDLMGTYSQMGDELSALSTEVSAATTEWMKQGQSIEESNELAKSSIVLSKIGEISSEDSTQYLTAALKGYQMSTDMAMDVVDKISTVDMASATSVNGLAEGMSKVASAARLVNVDFDTLLGYLAAIGETTQQDMSSVGNALNTIFARMRNIKLGRLKDYQDETGEDLSNVETVLKGEGINLRDSSGQFRNFKTVLDETAAEWKNFSKVSQSAIAQAFAGKMCARTCSDTWILAYN